MVMADKGYDSDRFRIVIAAAGAEAVIPSIGSRSQPIPYDKHIYQERNLVERFINKIKHFRRIATRYEKTAISFASMLFLVGAMIWLR
jgi:transposase